MSDTRVVARAEVAFGEQKRPFRKNRRTMLEQARVDSRLQVRDLDKGAV